MDTVLVFKLLLLLLVANGAPVLLATVMGEHGNWPVDAGRKTRQGRPWFGRSKTWRGVIAATAGTALVGYVLGWSPVIAALFGFYAMLGDLGSSFVKRRLGLAPSSRATGLDQIPEATLPLLLLQQSLKLNSLEVVVVVLLFFVIELALSKLLYRWHIRKEPY